MTNPRRDIASFNEPNAALTFNSSLIRLQNQMNIELATSQPGQISMLRNEHPQMLELTIALLLRGLDASLNATNKMNEDQLEECCLMIIEKYWMLRPEEIMLVFKNAKMGKYGKDYNRIDMATIFTWIDTYVDNERYPYFEQKPKLEPDLMPLDEFNELYEEYKLQTAETGTSEILDRLKWKSLAKNKQRDEDEFKKFYQAEYLKQSKEPGFVLARFEAAMQLVKEKMSNL